MDLAVKKMKKQTKMKKLENNCGKYSDKTITNPS